MTMPAKPLKRGKTPEQYASDVAAYNLAMRTHSAEMAKAKRERAISLGMAQYDWLAVDVHGCCEVAQRNGGKRFSLTEPPPEGHVGEGECSSPDWCRCIAAPIIESMW